MMKSNESGHYRMSKYYKCIGFVRYSEDNILIGNVFFLSTDRPLW